MALKPRVLLVNSGSQGKQHVLEHMVALGYEIVLLNPTLTWEASYVADWIQANPWNHQECLMKVLNYKGLINAVWTYWEEDCVLTAELADALHLPGSSVRSMESTRNKYTARTVFSRKGLNTPQFALVQTETDLNFHMSMFSLPAVFKPVGGSGSVNMMRVDRRQQINEMWAMMQRATPSLHELFTDYAQTYVLESYIGGDEFSVDGWVNDKGVVSCPGITFKTPVIEPLMIKTGVITPPQLSATERNTLVSQVANGVRALGLTNTLFHAEVKLWDSKAYLIEINPRLCGSFFPLLYRLSSGLDFIQAGIEIALGKQPTTRAGDAKTLCGQYVLPSQLGTVQQVISLNGVSSQAVAHRVFAAPGDRVTHLCDYLAWVIVQGCTKEEAYAKARELVNHFQISIK